MQGRVRFMAVLVVIFMLILGGRVAQLQLVEGESLLVASVQQRLRVLSIPAPRGKIFAADDTVLATNRPAFVVQYLPGSDPLTESQMTLLSDLINVPVESILAAIREQRSIRPYAPVDLKVDLTPREYTALMENRYLMPGIRVEALPVRNYPQGVLASHVLGYVLKIAEHELRTFGEMSGRTYDNRDLVGKAGVERTMEFDLQGHDGEVRVEVDAYMRLVDSVIGYEPRAGDDVHLTLDSSLQAVAERALITVCEKLQEGHDPVPLDLATGRYLGLWQEGHMRPADSSRPSRTYPDATSAAAVVIDVRTGAVLAMASHPAFDPNDFATAPLHLSGTEGAAKWEEQWRRLNDPAAGQPLLNRTISQISPPGSSFKMVTALAALEAGLDPARTVTCHGALDIFDQQYGCWTAHGATDLHRAIAQSCNVYFYRAGLDVGIDRLADMARALGFGEPTGLLGLPPGEERGGTLPSRAWKQEALGEMWYPGETLMAAIGQGFHAHTPMQLAVYTATIANGGTRYRPYVVDRLVSVDGEVLWEATPKEVATLPVSPENLRLVQAGMEGAALPGGSAYRRFQDYPQPCPERGEVISVAAKTGTAEVGTAYDRRDSHGWFVAYAPAEDPEIAVAVVIYHGGGGSLAAAPVTRAIIDEYFGFTLEADTEPGE